MLSRYFFAVAVMAVAIVMKDLYAPITTSASTPVNPLTQKWTGPYGGVPPFDKVRVADFKPALEQAMAENLKEIDAIANNRAKPTFANTFVPLETSGQMLTRVARIFDIWASSMNSDEFAPVEEEMRPRLSAHYDKIYQNAALFKRIEAVNNSPAKARLTKEQQRLVQVYYENFVHAERRRCSKESAAQRDQPAACRPLRKIQPEPAGRGIGALRSDRKTVGARWSAAVLDRFRRRGRKGQRQERLADKEHPLGDRPIPDLRREPRPA